MTYKKLYAEGMTTISVSEMRSNLREVLERVKQGEEVHVTQNGEIVAALLHPDRLKWRVRTPHTLAAERLLAEFDEPLPLPEASLSRDEGEALVERIRRERDEGR